MKRAIHRLEVVVRALTRNLAGVVAQLVEVHGREHPVLVPTQVAGRFKQGLLRDVRRIDELVTTLVMSLAGVILHLATDDATFRVEHREPRTDLVGEREQVEFSAESTVVAFCRLVEAFDVFTQLLLGRPTRSVNPLQRLVLLRTAPIGSGGPHQFVPLADHSGVGKVGAATQVFPHRVTRLGIDVVVDGQLGTADLNAFVVLSEASALEADEFQLERFTRELCARLVL